MVDPSFAEASTCPTQRALDLIRDRWATRVLAALAGDGLGFNALQRRLHGISAKMLAQTLRRQEAAGTVVRTQFDTVPATVHYALTPLGRSLLETVRDIRDWADEHRLHLES